MKLSILIPSIFEREEMLERLRDELQRQIDECQKKHPSLGTVGISTRITKKYIHGGESVGLKRDTLIQDAEGEYVIFIDDDERPAPNYVETILRMAASGADILTFRSFASMDNMWALIDMDLSNPNEQINPNGITRRKPFHICAVKASIAKQHRFNDMNNAEDWDWMSRVLIDVRTQNHTNMILHSYIHSAAASAVDEIEKAK